MEQPRWQRAQIATRMPGRTASRQKAAFHSADTALMVHWKTFSPPLLAYAEQALL